MSEAHRRGKDPKQVRRALLDAAARMVADAGLAALSIPAVAAAAGVTKGALFHHFTNKQGLVEAVCADLLEDLDAQIDHYLSLHEHSYGCFTRAYVEAVFAPASNNNPWGSLSISLLSDIELVTSWSEWMRRRIEQHRDTDATPALEAVRYAADGFWLAELMRVDGSVRAERDAMRGHLLDLIDKGP